MSRWVGSTADYEKNPKTGWTALPVETWEDREWGHLHFAYSPEDGQVDAVRVSCWGMLWFLLRMLATHPIRAFVRLLGPETSHG